MREFLKPFETRFSAAGVLAVGPARNLHLQQTHLDAHLQHLAAVAGILLALALSGFAEDAAKELAKIEAQLKKKPDDPMLHYRKAQFQMKLEKYDEGYATAQKAMELFIKIGDDLAWLLLESVDLKNVAVDVHFNMGPKERNRPQMGIVRPLSFRIWSKGARARRSRSWRSSISSSA